jgi:hypothetical protein
VKVGVYAAVAVAAPACLLAVGSTVALTRGLLDRNPTWSPPPFTLSEAAGLDDEAEVVRLIERGGDPNAAHEVRIAVISPTPTRLTPLEAAVISKNPSMIATLLTRGAIVDADGWNRLRCRTDEDDVIAMLDSHRPAGATTHCGGNRSAPGQVVN